MEEGIDGPVLLLGEANFSFSLSLIKYCQASLVTASCYESREEAARKYGAEALQFNLDMLKRLNCGRVCFEVDATKLSVTFPEEKFSRLIFMFPHVGGKSNLKKNRELLEKFLCSAREVLAPEGSVFVALAKGQGGTRFEEEKEKRDNKDSWQILQLAHKNGFLLTDCRPLDEAKFAFYKSTGFRSGQKSFATKSGLVHRLQLSLPPIEYPLVSQQTQNNNKLVFPFIVENFLRKTKFISSQNKLHPLNELAIVLTQRISNILNLPFKQIEDDFRKCLVSEGRYLVEGDNLALFGFSEDETSPLFIRSSMRQVLETQSLNRNELHFISGLVLDSQNTFSSLQNLKFETVFYFHGSAEFALDLQLAIFNEIKALISFQLDDKNDLIQFELNSDQLVVVLNNSLLLMKEFDVADPRLVFSDDLRVLVDSDRLTTKRFNPFSVAGPTWNHDLSFWYEKDSFSMQHFIDVVRDAAQGLVSRVELVDEYVEKTAELTRRAFCFRLVYEPYDRALSWNQTTQLQYFIRQQLAAKLDNFLLR